MENNELQGHIEAYFAALEAPLSAVPIARREEFLTETRAHLGAMVKAKRADGIGEEAAWNAAMNEFGEPREVGGALWKAWATSGQLESEGAPLSKRELAKKYLPRMAAVMGAMSLFRFLPEAVWHSSTFLAVCALWIVGCLSWGSLRFWRSGGRWTAFTSANFVFFLVSAFYALGQLQWGETWRATEGGRLAHQWFPLLPFLFCPLYFYLYKRDLKSRPWRFGAFAGRFKQSPVAAEQEYRLSPALGLLMGGVFGCGASIVSGVQIFGLAHELWKCAARVIVSLAIGLWLYCRK